MSKGHSRREDGWRDDVRRDYPRRDDSFRDESRRGTPRRDEARRYDSRRDEPRRDESRRENSRRESTRRDDSRRDDGWIADGRREDMRRSDTRRDDMRRADDVHREDARFDNSRRGESRRDDGRHDDARYGDTRYEEARREDGRHEDRHRDGSRRDDERRADQRRNSGRYEDGKRDDPVRTDRRREDARYPDVALSGDESRGLQRPGSSLKGVKDARTPTSGKRAGETGAPRSVERTDGSRRDRDALVEPDSEKTVARAPRAASTAARAQRQDMRTSAAKQSRFRDSGGDEGSEEPMSKKARYDEAYDDSQDEEESEVQRGTKAKPNKAPDPTEEEVPEEDIYSNDGGDSDSADFEVTGPRSRERLTARQRSLLGEDADEELVELDSSDKRKGRDLEDWTKDEENEIKRQQKARLRNMVNEKRNREKRAAMVDKVLRGVTSKRKRISLAAETSSHAANANAGPRPGFARYVSGKAGASISIPDSDAVPAVLAHRQGPVQYPPKCARDPRTGKRILTSSHWDAPATKLGS